MRSLVLDTTRWISFSSLSVCLLTDFHLRIKTLYLPHLPIIASNSSSLSLHILIKLHQSHAVIEHPEAPQTLTTLPISHLGFQDISSTPPKNNHMTMDQGRILLIGVVLIVCLVILLIYTSLCYHKSLKCHRSSLPRPRSESDSRSSIGAV